MILKVKIKYIRISWYHLDININSLLIQKQLNLKQFKVIKMSQFWISLELILT